MTRIGLGEDGPTHQPVEHLASLRAMPQPACLPPRRRDGDRRMLGTGGQRARRAQPAGAVPPDPADAPHRHRREPLRPRRLRAGRGGAAPAAHADRHRLRGVVALAARAALEAEGIATAVVSLPCWELFARRTPATATQVLGSAPRVGIEAAVGFGWERWLGDGRGLHRHERLRRLGPGRGSFPAFRYHARGRSSPRCKKRLG